MLNAISILVSIGATIASLIASILSFMAGDMAAGREWLILTGIWVILVQLIPAKAR